MARNGTFIQLLVIGLSIALFVGLVIAPKNYSVAKLKEKKVQETKSDIDRQINEIKKELKPFEFNKLSEFESNFDAANKETKVQWLDSIIGFWDGVMRPQIAAIYTKDKAELTGSLEDMNIAGEKFINVARFMNEEDKAWAYNEAKACFEIVLEKDPENADAKINMGICIVQTNPENPMAGIGMLREVLDKDPNNTRAILQLGHFSVLSGQFSKALERYEQALEIDPNLTEAYFFIGDTYAKMEDFENAEKYLLIFRSYLEDEQEINQLDIYLDDLKQMSNN